MAILKYITYWALKEIKTLLFILLLIAIQLIVVGIKINRTEQGAEDQANQTIDSKIEQVHSSG